MAGSEISKPTRVRIPGSNVFMVDANKDGHFAPSDCPAGQVNPQGDYYEEGPRPLCPNDSWVVFAFGKMRLSPLWRVDMSRAKKIMELCHRLFNCTQAVARKQAAADLNDLEDSLVIPPLIKALFEDPEEMVRAQAADTLGQFRDKSVISAFAKALQEDKSPLVREKIIKKLTIEWKDPILLEALRQTLKRNLDFGNSVDAAHKLGMFKDASAIPVLEYILDNQNNDDLLRDVAGRTLEEIGDPSAIPILEKAIERYHDIPESVFFVLAKLAGPAAVPTLDRFLQRNGREGWGLSKSEEMRESATRSLGTIVDSSAVPPLIEVAENDKSEEVRLTALYALEQLSEKIEAPAIFFAFARIYKASESDKIRTFINNVLRRAVQSEDKSEKVRKAATEAIRKITEKSSAEPPMPGPSWSLPPVTLPPKNTIKKKKSALPFMGFSTSDLQINSETLSRFTEAFLAEAKKRNFKVVIPDIPEIADELKIHASCNDVKCTAEICGALGASSGFYGKIEWVENDQKYMIRLHHVLQKDAAIAHQATLFVSKADLKKSGSEIAVKLAQKMFRQLEE